MHDDHDYTQRNRASYPNPFSSAVGNPHCNRRNNGAALDALTAELPEDANESSATLVLVQKRKPDVFFTAEQQTRLSFLMERLHAARDRGQSLPAVEQHELDTLVEAEVIGMGKRAQALLDEASR